MITQEKIYLFFENIAEEFRKENIPILNNIIHDFKNYPFEEDLYIIEEEEEEEEDQYFEENILETS